MSLVWQQTIRRSLSFTGVGLHSGKLVKMQVHPAPADTGFVFFRTDLQFQAIVAHPDHIIATNLCTTLGNDKMQIATVEHLLAALVGCGVDNAYIEVNSSEIPILDGSAAPFVDQINEAGLKKLTQHKRIVFLPNPVSIEVGDQYIRYLPPASEEEARQLEITCSISFPSKAIGAQSYSMLFSLSNFLGIHEARTFCHINDVLAMRSQGLASGGSLDNAVVVDDEKVLNNDGLRYADEFVKHKLLDFIGDTAMLNGRLVGKVFLHKAGHRLHALFMKKVLEQWTPLTYNYQDLASAAAL